MFVYERKVSFIDYYINGIRSGNIGVVRQKVTEDILWLKVEWLSGADAGNLPWRMVITTADRKEQCHEIKQNTAGNRWIYQIPLEELNPDKSKKIIFYFNDGNYGIADLCCLPERQAVYDRNLADEKPECGQKEEEGKNEKIETDTGSQRNEKNIVSEIIEEKNVEDAVNQKELPASDCEESNEALAECLEAQPDKWETIKKKYPILYPFKGQGPYVSIKPVDLQLLSPKYHGLADNSYLMHGFYRYRHMILGEYSMEKGTFFYVGVPGEFVKKEQTSAAMFGFEGYEHSGDLGYYLYRVEL
ncbi:MAG: hypothetical protein IJ336_04515 [Lachnospiraceae bacterium]|nr:hypothetical protein [Lachnospiraceae bacterium]